MRFVSAFLMVLFSFSLSVFAVRADEHILPHQMPGMNKSPQDISLYSGTGQIKSWGENRVSIKHLPIAQLNWPAMTMSFELSGYQGEKFMAGQEIDFTFRQTDSGYRLVSASAK